MFRGGIWRPGGRTKVQRGIGPGISVSVVVVGIVIGALAFFVGDMLLFLKDFGCVTVRARSCFITAARRLFKHTAENGTQVFYPVVHIDKCH